MTSNWFDRTIAFIAPEIGARRMQSRMRLESLRRASSLLAGYEGASQRARLSGWNATGTSANTEIYKDLRRLRDRSRELVRNNYFAAHAIDVLVDTIIAYGITVRWPGEQVQEAWERWSAECSADGLANFESIQRLACRSMKESGEVIIRRRWRRRKDALDIPLQLQVMEADYLDLDKTGKTDTGYIMHGVEFDMIGRRVAYWLFPQHPGDPISTSIKSGSSHRVPANEILHIYQTQRPGQVRGVPVLSPVLVSLRDSEDWEEAELVRKKVEACLAAFVTSPETASFTFTGESPEKFTPGMITRLQPGEDVHITQPSFAGGYAEFKRCKQHDQSAGVGVPYQLATGDFSQSNYSSSRMGLIQFQRAVEAEQWDVWIPQLCSPVARWFAEASGMFAQPLTADQIEFGTPAFNLLDRETEAKADEIELRIGKTTWPRMVAAQGYDARKQLDEINEYREPLEEAGVTFGGTKPAANGDTNNGKETPDGPGEPDSGEQPERGGEDG